MRKRLVLAFVFVLAMSATVFVGCATANEGPVAADKAQIEMTYTDDGTSYEGDRKIIQGTASVTFSNETAGAISVDVFRYETGSDGLAEELALVQEGNRAVLTGPPVAGFNREFFQTFQPGSNTWTMTLIPGTYIFDAGPSDYITTGLWRLAVIEVVDE